MIDRLGFDNEKYLEMQSEHIRSRIDQFGGKLYLEFGGKLFDDNHASRVLPGFHPDSKIRMLMQLKDQVEIVVAVSAMDLEKSKVRGDLGITYGTDTLRLIDVFRGFGFQVNSVVLTRFSGQPASVKRATVRTNTSRPAAPWWSSPPPAPAAARWPCA